MGHNVTGPFPFLLVAAAIFAVILLKIEILCSTLRIIFSYISGLIILYSGGQQCEGEPPGGGQVPHPSQVPADPGV